MSPVILWGPLGISNTVNLYWATYAPSYDKSSKLRPNQVEKDPVSHLVEEHLEGVNQLVGDALVYSHPGLGKE